MFSLSRGEERCRRFGVHSEVGKLRTVMVCRPGLAHQRLTPGNASALLFDDVLWVHEAQKDHYDFVLKMRERDVEVLELHDLLAETVADQGRSRLGSSIDGSRPTTSGWAWRRSCAPGSTSCRPPKLAEHLIGGIAILDLPKSEGAKMLAEAFGGDRLHHPADSEHALPARPLLLDLQGRDLQPDVLAGAPAGDVAPACGLQVPPALQGRRLQDLVGRQRRTRTAPPRSKAATSCRSARASC